MKCAVDDCEREKVKRGWCDMHYQRWRDKGNLHSGRELPISRFFSKLEFGVSCWGWEGDLSPSGYGIFTVGGKPYRAHVWIYEYFYGPVPEGMVLDHYECSRRDCGNPTHVRPVSPRENLLRSDTSAAALNTAKTSCKNGHPLEGDNLIWCGKPGKQWRGCRACRREASYRSVAKKRVLTRGG